MSEILGKVKAPPNAFIPDYLQAHYWWAYVHPTAVKLFEREWLVNLILWFNYRRLGRAALEGLGDLSGRTLQIACVYGDLTARLVEKAAASGGSVDIIDVLPIQLDNLRRKLQGGASARLLLRDAEALALPDASYDSALLFFLLHEQPEDARRRTLREALRVVRPGGSIVVVDFARPSAWHPARFLWLPILRVLEPFARDLWRRDITTWLPHPWCHRAPKRWRFFGGLYQVVRITR